METVCCLSYGEEHYVSTRRPDTLPPDRYSLIEIEYDSSLVTAVRAEYYFGDVKETLLLADLPIVDYLKRIQDTTCEVTFQGVDQPEDRAYRLCLLYMCSYLCYYNFVTSKQPSLDLLDCGKIQTFLELPVKSELETGWKKQVDYLLKQYGYLFETVADVPEHSEYLCDPVEDNIHKIVNKYLENNLEKTIEKVFKKHLDKSLKQIDEEASAIGKQMRDFKKKLLSELNK